MDSKGHELDNIFVKCLWLSVKYEILFPSQWETMQDARIGLKEYFKFYNQS